MLFFAMEKTEQCCGFVEFNVLDGTSKNKNGSLTWIRTKTK